ncbi:MAG: exodeoxyribonuclease VII large subunit [Treponema sp.]|nr:exodeoxyribonuclease VII large subunit [Treponema sp.]
MSELFPASQIFTVTQITQLISDLLENTFPSVCIEGEISNWRPYPSGHNYFTLKDDKAQIKAVIFKFDAQHMTFKPKDGDKVKATGKLSVYGPQGNYQIIVKTIENTGSGNILMMLEQRKQKLAQEGLFDENKKKKLPFFPKTIGVVTSSSGAAIRDIINVAVRRNPGINIILFPSLVQGDGAAQSIVKMIELANFYKMCDVLIVGRGGGSLEDLLAFSEEEVVRAAYASEIPLISAVGHEIDWALIDFASDVRAPTPSAAAEIAVPCLSDIISQIDEYKKTIINQTKQKVSNARLLVRSFNPENLEIRFRRIQQPLLNRFSLAKEALINNLNEKIRDLKNRINSCTLVLEQANPQVILERGYSMVTDENGTIIHDSNQLAKEQNIIIKPAKGKIYAAVKDIQSDGGIK